MSSVAAKGLLTKGYSSRNASQHSSKPMTVEYVPNASEKAGKSNKLSVIRETDKDLY